METPARHREINKSPTKSRSPVHLIRCCSGKRPERPRTREQPVPLKRASPGGWAVRGDRAVARPCWCPPSTRSLVTPRRLHLQVRKPLAKATDPALRASQASRPPSLPASAPARLRGTGERPPGKPHPRGGQRASAGAGQAASQLQIRNGTGDDRPLWTGGGVGVGGAGEWPSESGGR